MKEGDEKGVLFRHSSTEAATHPLLLKPSCECGVRLFYRLLLTHAWASFLHTCIRGSRIERYRTRTHVCVIRLFYTLHVYRIHECVYAIERVLYISHTACA